MARRSSTTPRKAAAGRAKASKSAATPRAPAEATAATIDPSNNDLTLNPTDTVDETIKVTLPKGAKCRSLTLVASPSITPLVGSIDPHGGFSGVAGGQTAEFRVRFHGQPCKTEPQIVTGTLDALCDERVITRKAVRITIPACPPVSLIYSAKFVCGVQGECGCDCTPIQPGRYATLITIHNIGRSAVTVGKRIIPIVLAGAPVGREPALAGPRAEDRIVLPPQCATSDDCCRLTQLLFGGEVAADAPLTLGFLEITADGPLGVSAIYTTTGLEAPGVSIEVTEIAPHRV